MKINNSLDCITDFIFVEDKPQKSDIILIPGSEDINLAKKAAWLFKHGYSQRILISGGYNKNIPKNLTEAEYFCEYISTFGISKSNITLEKKARNTFENAKFSREIIKENKLDIKKIILVCKGYHSRRALLTYQRYFPSDTKFYVVSIDGELNINSRNWMSSNDKIEIVMSEVVKIGTYFKSEVNYYL